MASAKSSNPISCDICSGQMDFSLVGQDFLYKTTTKKFSVYKCNQCGLEKIHPTPSNQDIYSFYPKSYYSYNTSSAESKKGIFTRIREKIIDNSYAKTANNDLFSLFAIILKPFLGGIPLVPIGKMRFLDVGCGDGYNLQLLRKHGWHTTGFEIGEKRIENGIYYDNKINDVDFKTGHFDAIRVWHVLEHSNSPQMLVGKLSKLLSQGGKLYIGVPNNDSIYAKIFGKYWYNRDLPRHLYNYNPYNLQKLLSDNNLKVISIKHTSTGGLLGSLQHFINHKYDKNINLVDNFLLVVLLLPIDILCNILKKGDCISLIATK